MSRPALLKQIRMLRQQLAQMPEVHPESLLSELETFELGLITRRRAPRNTPQVEPPEQQEASAAAASPEAVEPERFRWALEMMQGGYWTWDIPTGTVHWSPEVCELLQVPREQLMTLDSFEQLLDPEHRELLHARIGETLNSGAPYEIEFPQVRPSGEVRWIFSRGSLHCSSEGEPLELRGVVWDITEQKLAAQESQRLLERLKLVMQAAKFGTQESCMETGELLYDDFYAHMQELPLVGEVPLEELLRRVHPGDRAALEELLDIRLPRLPPGTAVSLQYRYQMNDGSWQWREATFALSVRDGNHWRTGAVRDITEQKESEIHREHLLRLSALGEASAGLAHELKSPLAAIDLQVGVTLMQLQQLEDSEAAEKIEDRLSGLQVISQSILQRLEQMQRLSRREEEHRPQPCALAEVWSNVRLLCSHDLQQKKVQLREELPKDLPLISGYPIQLEQMLLNLINNARDAVETAKRREIQVRFLPEAEQVCVEVQDSGTGMDPHTQQRLFEKFFTTKEQGRGTGLGMSIVQRAVEAHRGRIELQSEIGEGTLFRIFLPKLDKPSSS